MSEMPHGHHPAQVHDPRDRTAIDPEEVTARDNSSLQ